jgi:hypothetical protein
MGEAPHGTGRRSWQIPQARHPAPGKRDILRSRSPIHQRPGHHQRSYVRPARGTGVALVVFLVGAGWVGGGLYRLDERVDSFQRVALPGEGEVNLDHSGGYVIYYEGPGAAEGTVPPFTVNVTPLSESAVAPELEAYGGGLTYSFGSREGRGVLTLRVDSPGRFLIEARDAPAVSGGSFLAIGSSIAGGIVRIVVPALVLMVAAVSGAIALAIVRRRRRQRVRATGP